MNRHLPLVIFLAAFALPVLDGSMTFAQQVIAHRGASFDAPENTLASFRLAWQQGADGIEGDFYLTADGEIVCLHDSDTARTGDRKLSVGQATLAELRKVDVGAWRGEKFRNERIPTLTEVLKIVPPGKQIYIEIKCGPQIIPALKNDLARSSVKPEQITIISFHEAVIQAVHKQLPEIRAVWLYSLPAKETRWPQLDPGPVLQKLQELGASGVGLSAEKGRISKETVERFQSAGYRVNAWTIDDLALAREYQGLGVDSITTDRPALIRNLLASDSTDDPASETN
jgi:glycerophosphoryl diester phosphodiesterase